MSSSSAREFRLAGKTFFLTWPQNDSDRDAVLSRVTELFGDDLVFAVVASEVHKDGEPHLHCICGFKSRKDLRNANDVLDPLTGKHGNYQAAKSAKKVLRYVCKDGNYVSWGEVPDFVAGPKIQDGIAKLILDGGDYKACVHLNAGYAMLQVCVSC